MREHDIVEELYNFGNTSIYVIYDPHREKKYVLKKIRSKGLVSELYRDMEEIFKREKEALKKINHPNIIKYIDSYVDDDGFNLITEYTEEMVSLEKNTLNFSEIKKLEILEDILKGLIECHNSKVIHRDLKPSNILISKDAKQIKIIDFGLSKIKDLLAEKSGVTVKGYMTPHYSSPEQLRGERLSEESDIYSLGLIAYYLFCGEEPQMERKKIYSTLDNSSIDVKIQYLIKKALYNVREDRYSNAELFLREVLKVKYQIEADQSEVFLNFKSSIATRLKELGKIGTTHDLTVQKFIEDSLGKHPNIFMNIRSEYMLIGDKIRYEVTFNKKNEVILEKVWNIELEKRDFEKSKGVLIGAKINIVKNRYDICNPTDSTYIEYLKEKISQEFKENSKRIDDKNKLNGLLKVWNTYLKQKKQEAFNKTELGRFSDFDYDEVNNYLSLQVEDLKEKEPFEKEDIIQLTSKQGKKIIVGKFHKYKVANQISIIPNSDFNEKNFKKRGIIGINNYLANILTNRYSIAMKQLLSNTSINRELLEILNTPQLASFTKERYSTSKWFNREILPETKKLVQEILSTNDLYLVQGPPGTGKTTLITELVAQIYYTSPRSKVLFVSPSHVAVDHAIRKIRKQLKSLDGNIDKKIVRLGREFKISAEHEIFQMDNHSKAWAEKIKKKSINYLEDEANKFSKKNNKKYNLVSYLIDSTQSNRDELSKYIDNTNSFHYKKYEVIKDWYQNLSQNSQFELEIIKDAFLIGSTCSGIASYDVFDNIEFDWVIIDEAARATVPELLIPMVRGKRIILVGDHKQLPPVVNFDENDISTKEVKNTLEESLFKTLHDSITGDLKATLKTQFRMKSEIGNMINKLYYSEVEINNSTQHKEYILEDEYKPISWIDTNTSPDHNEISEGTSYKNYQEATKTIQFLDELNDSLSEHKRKKTVGIISGYEAQRILLDSEVNKHKWNYLDIVINNVDAFQGSEKDIIIYSIVRSNQDRDLGYLKDERRLNVSLSRAKEMLVIVGNTKVAEYTPYETNPFIKLFNYIISNPKDCKLIQ
ncbi:AAA domain-containing protein [Listeria monocytogenes]|nr:protein kinase [Listeria monocytogenes]